MELNIQEQGHQKPAQTPKFKAPASKIPLQVMHSQKFMVSFYEYKESASHPFES